MPVLALLIATWELSLRRASAEVIQPARWLLPDPTVFPLFLNVAEPLFQRRLRAARAGSFRSWIGYATSSV